MRKILIFCLVVLSLCLSVCFVAADNATEIVSSGLWEYEPLEDGTIGITKYAGEEEKITIPSEIDGKPVSKIISMGWIKCREITIPGSVVSIDHNPFSSSSSLINIVVSDDNAVFAFRDNALFDEQSKRLVCFPRGNEDKKYSVPEGTLIIGQSAFSSCHNLKEISLPDSIVEIEKAAFSGCYDIKEIIIPSKVTVIEDQAFSDCESLRTVAFPEGLTKIGTNAFYFCSALRELTLPEGLITINDKAFSYCTGLSSVSIPNSVTEYLGNPFLGCDKLKSILVLPEHPVLAVIDNVLFNKTEKKLLYYPYALMNKKYSIPDGIKIIGENAFADIYELTSVDIPDSVTDIEDGAFEKMAKLRKIDIPASVRNIGRNAFASCRWLEEVTMSEGVTNIGAYAFAGCGDLEKIAIPNSVVSIDEGAFSDCAKLTVNASRDSYAVKYCMENGVNYTFPGANDWLNN